MIWRPSMSPARQAARLLRKAACVLAAVLASGCATQGGDRVDQLLQLVGLKAPAAPQSMQNLPSMPAPITRQLTLRLHAAEVLNTDHQGRSLSVVARVYKLRGSAAFQQASYEALAAASPDRAEPWVSEVLEVRELTLVPGQRHEVVETLPPEAARLAVVTLFRAPAEQRWRFVFDGRASAGITLGLHGCAMSVAEGAVVDAAPETLRLAGVRCR